jgi:hypothetical protein
MNLEKLITGREIVNQIWIRELCNVPDNFLNEKIRLSFRFKLACVLVL